MKTSATLRVHPTIADVGRHAWDACTSSLDYRDNPFISFDFLHALEVSGCVAQRTGWTPTHLSYTDAGGGVTGVAPLYLKAHSQGEYVFDHAWAQAYMQAGGDYYPKLLCAAPFSPSPVRG